MSDSLPSGTQVGPYTIEGLIGTGGMGQVYLATEVRLRRKVALKVISPSLTSNADSMRRFKIEGRTLALVSHPNVVAIYAIDNVAELHYIAMELVEGRSLSDLCHFLLWPAEEAAPLFMQILEGVQALHTKNVIHRDLKPGNIIYQKDSLIKIIDLGIAKSFDDQTVNATTVGMMVGTVRYMAPEIALGRQATTMSDIFSLGSIFYEMLTGSGLIQSNNHVHALSQLANINVSFTPEMQGAIPQEMQQIVKKMCAKEIQDRYRSVGEIIEDLRAFMSKYPDRGRWSYAVCGRNITNFGLVRQHLVQHGNSEFATKYILFQSVIENARVLANTAASASNQTTKLGADLVEELTPASVNTAMTEVQRASNRYGKPKLFSPLNAAIAVAVLVLVTAGVFIAKTKKSTPTPSLAAEPQPPAAALVTAAKTVTPTPAKVESTPVKTAEIVSEVEPVTISTPPQNIELDVEHPFAVPAQVTAPKVPTEAPEPKFQAPDLKNKAVHVLLGQKKMPPLRWGRMPGAKEYQIQISHDSTFAKTVVSQSVAKPEFLWTGVVPGEYFWRVRAVTDGTRSSYSSLGKLSVHVTAPQIAERFLFQLKLGPNGRVTPTQDPLRISWIPSPQADGYRLLIASDPEFKNVIESVVTRAPTATVEAHDASVMHTKVIALDQMKREISSYSSVARVIAAGSMTLSAPVLTSPPAYKKFTVGAGPISILLFWNPVRSAESYELQLATGTDFANVVFSKIHNTNQFIIKNQLPKGTIHWRVRAVSDKGLSPWSRPLSFGLD